MSDNINIEFEEGGQKIQGKASEVPTTKGDMLIYNGTEWESLAIGSDTQQLTADSGESAGVKWGDANNELARIPGSTYSTVQDLQDIFHSAGWISGGGITDDADGTITVAVGTGLIRATDSSVAEILFTDWTQESGANVNLADNDISYVYVEYNAGSPRVIATITQRTDFNKNILLGTIQREGTTLHINEPDRHAVGDHANAMVRRLKAVQPYGHASGAILSETGTRNIAVTAGTFWRGLVEFSTSARDTSAADTFSAYQNNGSWQKITAQTQIDNTQFNDFGVGLDTLSNNRYGVHWVYLEADDDDISIVYGIGDFTLQQAEDASIPSSVPEHLIVEGILIGKIIIQESTATFTQIESAFTTTFTGSIATDHVNLANIGTNTHDQIDTHIADSAIHINIKESGVASSVANATETVLSTNFAKVAGKVYMPIIMFDTNGGVTMVQSEFNTSLAAGVGEANYGLTEDASSNIQLKINFDVGGMGDPQDIRWKVLEIG